MPRPPVFRNYALLAIVVGATLSLLAPSALAGSASAGPATTGTALHWSLLTPSPAPSARAWVTMADDPSDGYVVLYGGYNAYTGIYSDTWTYSAGNWTQLAQNTTPGGAIGLTLAYDPALHGVLTFGGQYAAPQTWLFKSGNWSQIVTKTAPPARFGYAMAYDAYDHEMVMFGGQAGNNTNVFLSDTWVFNGTDWARVPGYHHPTGRIGASMVYDAALQSVLLVGGRNTSYGVGETGTWAFQNGTWNWLYGAHTPAPRNFPYLTTLGNGTPVMYGGTTPNGATYYDGTWEFYGAAWHHVYAKNLPSGRNDGAITYDASDGYVLMFGGSIPTSSGYHTYTAQTWTLQ